MSKNVEAIHHWKTDMYYRCLLLLDADRLRAMLEAMAGNADNWFRDQLKDVVDSIDSLSVAGGEHEDVAALPALSAPAGASGFGDVVQSSGFTRAVVNAPDLPSVRVYFDHGSHQSGRHRGWVDCGVDSHLNCIHYEFVGSSSRKDLLALMHPWYLAGPHCTDKRLLLAYMPSSQEAQDMSDVFLNCTVF